MKNIYLNKESISRLSHNDFLAYVALKSYIDKHIITPKNAETIKIYVTVDMLIFSLLDTFENDSRTLKDCLTKGLKSLIENGVIELIEQSGKNYFVDLYNFYIDVEQGDKYFTVSDEEIKSTLTIEKSASLFHYAMAVFSTIWNGDKGYGCNTIDTLAEMSDISKPSALTYNTSLEEHRLIYIKRNDFASRDESGQIKNQANTYGRYENRDKIDLASKEHSTRMFDKTKNLDSNTKRSINARYKSYINGTFKGNIQLLYEDVIKYNADYNTKVGKSELDLSVFPDNIEELDKIEPVKPKTVKAKAEKKKFFEPVIIDDSDDDPFGLDREQPKKEVEIIEPTNYYEMDLDSIF